MNEHGGIDGIDGRRRPGSELQHRRAGPALAGGTMLAHPRDDRFEAEPVEHALSYHEVWRTLVKWRWLTLGMTVGMIAIAAIVTFATTKVYRASSRLEIASEEMKLVNTDQSTTDSVQMARPDYLRTQYGLLESSSLAQTVARSLNLLATPGFGAAGNGEQRDPDRALRASVDRLQNNLHITPVVESRLVDVMYDDPDPVRAALIANAFASNFMAMNIDRKLDSTAVTRDMLGKRLADVKTKLEESERAATEYARQAGIVELGGTGGAKDDGSDAPSSLSASSLVQVNTALTQAQQDALAAKQRYQQSTISDVTETLNSPNIQALSGQRAQLSAEYEEKLNLFKPDYPEMVQMRARITALDADIAKETGRVRNALRADYGAAQSRERALGSRVRQLTSSVQELSERSIRYNILRREVDTNRQLYDGLLQHFKEVGVADDIGASNVAIVDRADAPTAPIRPNALFNLGLGAVIGLLFGLIAAFTAEFMDDSIKTPEDIPNKLKLSLLGAVPKLTRGATLVSELGDPLSGVSEAYFSVRTALEFGTNRGAPKTMLLTSVRPAEGKSSSCFAIAQAFARLGHSVLLIDADLRKPSLIAVSADSAGLSNLLTGAEDYEAAIYPTNIDNLSLMPSGPIPPNPAELLAGSRIAELFALLTARFDYLIIDAPPVMGLADAPLISSLCEATIFVTEAGTRRLAARSAIQRLLAADAQIVGGLLTKFSSRSQGYGYGYGYGYGAKGKTTTAVRIAQELARRIPLGKTEQ